MDPIFSNPFPSLPVVGKDRYPVMITYHKPNGRRLATAIVRIELADDAMALTWERSKMDEFRDQGLPTVSMHLKLPQLWWAYLGLRSNPVIQDVVGNCHHVIFYGDQCSLSAKEQRLPTGTKYFPIFWDGISDIHQVETSLGSLDRSSLGTILVVGNCAKSVQANYDVQPLYPSGSIRFSNPSVKFDLKTSAMLFNAMLKRLVIPLKNIVSRNNNLSQSLELLGGGRQVVFCGSFGVTYPLLKMLCNRYHVDLRLFEGREWSDYHFNQSWEEYEASLHQDELFFAGLFEESKISEAFLISITRLLGRQYFINRVRHSGLPVYTNQFAQGSYIDVYSTPFYSQHVFLDFGSVVGSGNYPRLADLRYFNKKVVEISLDDDRNRIIDGIRSGTYLSILDVEWNTKSIEIMNLMRN